MHGDITTVSVAVNQRVFGPASLIRANAATSDHLLHISGQVVAKYHLPAEIKSPNLYIESSSRISNIHFDEKSIFDIVSFTLASEGVAGSRQEKGEKRRPKRLYQVFVRVSNYTFEEKSYLFVSTI